MTPLAPSPTKRILTKGNEAICLGALAAGCRCGAIGRPRAHRPAPPGDAPAADLLDQLLYTAFTRATAHLIVIAPPSLAARLRDAHGPAAPQGGR